MLRKARLTPDEKVLIARFWRSAGGFWRGPSARRAWLLVALLIATVMLQLFVQYRINFWNRDFFNAIERKDGAELWRQASIFVPLAAASLTLALVSVWGHMTTQRTWRAWLTAHLYDYWLVNDHHRKLRFIPGDHQNPEYRIAEDARLATDLPVDLTLGFLSSCLMAIVFIGVLWSVGGRLTINAFGFNLAIPGYLVIAVITYSLLVTTAMILIANHLTQVMENDKRAEAALRAAGTHIREVAEGTALPGSNHDARAIVGKALTTVIANWVEYCWQLMRTTLVSHTSTLLTPVVALLLCTPKFINDEMTLGEVVQAAAAFAIVQGAFGWIADSYTGIAEWTSSANRVASLLLALDEISPKRRDNCGSGARGKESCPKEAVVS